MTTKTFDAVKMMRGLRDQLSQELLPLTSQERQKHIREKAASVQFTAEEVDFEKGRSTEGDGP